ncbi:DUF6701 domain-containing protein [Shewanella fidelis]|uniref:DUF6701 domain-containing protein n=1 Tax=Shewanella fidelis TaxID=173509 RepID=UPI0004B6AB84|nr:DUF6701 domain-containing protein [Shewanella fidelis]
MIKYRGVKIALSVLFINLLVQPVLASNWSNVFQEGINVHNKNGKIEFDHGAHLENAPVDGKLPAKSVEDEQGRSCWPQSPYPRIECVASGRAADTPADRIGFEQCKSHSNNDISTDYNNREIDLVSDEYGHIHLNGGSSRKIRFVTNNGVYKIKHLKATSGNLEFAPGQYWIEELEINNGVNVIYPPLGAGTVSLFVKKAYEHKNRSLSQSAEQLLMYHYGDFTLNGATYLRGFVFSEKDIELDGSSSVEGAVSAKNKVELDGNSRVIFKNTAGNLNVTPNCELGPEPNPAVPAQCPAGQDNVQGLTYRTYDTRDWYSDNYSPANDSEFMTLVDDFKKTIYQIGESIEDNLNQKGNGINPHSNLARDQDLYLGIFEGYIEAPVTGEYTFAIDGDDAIELLIDGEVITGFYGTHATCNCTRYQGTVSLEEGAHRIELRFHEAFGYEAFKLYWKTPNTNSFSIVPPQQLLTCPSPQFEFGRAELSNDGIANISFNNSYAEPPVIVVMPTIDGSSPNNDKPSTLRVDNLTKSTAKIKQVNANGNSVLNKKMTRVDYFVMEPGYRFLKKGSALQAGAVSTAWYQGKRLPSAGRGYETVDFEHEFGSKPAMIGQSLTNKNRRFFTTVINNVDSDGDDFDIAIEGSEISGTILHEESLAYVAGIGRGTLNNGGDSVLYEFSTALNHGAGNSTRTLNQQCSFSNNYAQTYDSQPITIATKNQRKGGDGGWVRRCLKDSFNNTVSFVVDEDTALDNERTHLAESIGYFAFEYASEPPPVNHYRISFDSGALSCAAKPVTVQACANDNCSALLPDPAFITLTKNGSNYTSATFNGSTSLDVWHPQGGLVTLGLGNTTPSGEYRCYIDGSLVANSQCQLNFEDSGIYFDIDDSTSCKNSTNFELFAVKKDQNSQQCVPLFANQTKPLAMAFNYITPNASGITNAEKLTVNSLNAPQASVEISGGATEQLQVRFDANGKALLNVNYPEAGRVELEATLTEEISSPDGSTSETLVLSHSEQFVAKPDGFHFFNPSTANGCSGASCAKFAKAGDDFAMSVKAVCGVDDATPFKDRLALGNFRFSDLNIKAVLQAPLISNGDPEDGGLGGIGQSKLSFTKANSAPFNMGDQTYSEVGAISFALDGDVNYLGTTIAEANASSDIFGRFTPYFLSIEANTPKLQAQCNSLTYMDQPFGFQSGMEPTIAVKGMSKSGAETNNYQIGDWWRYHGNQWTDRSYSDTSGATSVDGAALAVQDVSPLSEQVDYYPTDQANTIQRAYLSGTQLSYPRTESLAVPFNASFDLVLNKADVTDSDGICHQDAAALTAGCKGFTFKDVAKDDAFAMRYGRMLLQNAYGPSSEELRLEVNTQYVDDNATWALNTADSCSVFDTTSAAESADIGLNLKPDAGLEAVEGYTQMGGTGKSGTIGLGNSFIYFPAPNADGEVGLQQHVDKWLQWYWAYDSAAGLQDPRATAYFGTYRGHDRIIYWREVN